MPTIRSTSADRSAICSSEVTSCARIASLNWAPIDFTGFSAFIALCMTTDRSFQRTAARSESVSPTMFRPLKITLPPVICAGELSSWAMANSSVDLPQPDSPTIARNSAGFSPKLTWSTATTPPASMAYSTDRSLTSRIVPASAAARLVSARGPGKPVVLARPSGPALACPPGSSLAGTLDTSPPDRPERRVPDLVEGVVEQGERGAEGDDAQAGNDDPQRQAGLEGLVVFCPVQHRSPAGHVRVAKPDELQAGGEQHRIQRIGQEGGHEQRRHRGDDLHNDDV